MKSICKNMFNCPVEATIRLIGGKYKAVILWHLMNQTLRYNEIHKRIPNATDKMLAREFDSCILEKILAGRIKPAFFTSIFPF